MSRAEELVTEIVHALSNKTPGHVITVAELAKPLTTYAAEVERKVWEEAAEITEKECARYLGHSSGFCTHKSSSLQFRRRAQGRKA